MVKDLFIPEVGAPVSEATVWKWFLNVPEELKNPFLSIQHKADFASYYREAGLLRGWRRPFFRNHYARTFAAAARFLLEGAANGRILDLGCGTGTQSIFFALLGADVVGLDMDEQALAILEKRKAFYEQASGRRIKLVAYQADALTFDYGKIAPIQGIYSMFAFNLMKPSRLLLERLAARTAQGGRLAILDGNCTSWLPKLVPSRRRPGCLAPVEFEEVLRDLSFMTVRHEAGCTVPPFLWCIVPAPLLRPIDALLGRYWLWAVSHQILAEKEEGTAL